MTRRWAVLVPQCSVLSHLYSIAPSAVSLSHNRTRAACWSLGHGLVGELSDADDTPRHSAMSSQHSVSTKDIVEMSKSRCGLRLQAGILFLDLLRHKRHNVGIQQARTRQDQLQISLRGIKKSTEHAMTYHAEGGPGSASSALNLTYTSCAC